MKLSIKALLKNLNENEGPQPGDIDYHYQEPQNSKGRSKFDDIDWQLIFEVLMDNTKIIINKEKLDKTVFSVNNLKELGLSQEDINILDWEDVVYIDRFQVPTIDDEKYLNYEAFYQAAKKAWIDSEKPKIKYAGDDSEAPYLRGRELDENNEDELTDIHGDGTSESTLLAKMQAQSDSKYSEMQQKVQTQFNSLEEAEKAITQMDEDSIDSYDFIFSINSAIPNSKYNPVFELKVSMTDGQPFYTLNSWTFHTENDGRNDYKFFGSDISISDNNIYDILNTIEDIVQPVKNTEQTVDESKTPEEREAIKKQNHEKFTDNIMKNSIMQESKKYEDIIFLQGSTADKIIRQIQMNGVESVFDYLKESYNSGKHKIIDNITESNNDKIYKKDNFIMSYNQNMGYIGLVCEVINEKAVSQQQQKFFGVVDALQKGEMKPSEASSAAKKAAKSMNNGDVKDFASTKYKELPVQKEEAFMDKFKPSKKLRDLINTISAWYEDNDAKSIDRVEKNLEKVLQDDQESSEDKIDDLKTKYRKVFKEKPVLEEEYDDNDEFEIEF